jgi:hypothetical protein
MTAEPSVSLERFAELRAEMDGGSRRDDVLAREKLGADAWIEVQRAWLERMGAEIEHGRFELTNRYSKAFVARQAALTPAVMPAPAPVPLTPAPPRAPSAPPTPPPAIVPTFLAASPMPPPPIPSISIEEPVPSTTPMPPVHAQSTVGLGGTASGVSAPFGPSLPFSPAPPGKTIPSSEPPPRPAAAAPAKERFGTTTASSSGASRPATPFEKQGPFGFTLERYAALAAELEIGGDVDAVLARHLLDREKKAKIDAHFQQRFAVEPVASLTFMRVVAEEAARLKKARSSAPPRRPSQPETPAVVAPKKAPFASTAYLSGDAIPKAALPFVAKQGGGEARPPELTLQQYASLCAELAAAATPALSASILAKYRVADPSARAALDAKWAAELAKAPASRAEFERLMAQYRAWLLRKP